MGFFDDLLFGSTETQQLPTMNPAQIYGFQHALNTIMGQMGQPQTQLDYAQYGRPGQYNFAGMGDPTQSEFYNSMGQSIQDLLSGRPAFEIDPAQTEQYYQDVIRSPMEQQYEDARTAALAKMGSLHSGERGRYEMESRTDLARDLSRERANLFYQDEQAKRQAEMMGRQLQGMGLQYGMGMTGQMQDYARLLAQQQMGQNQANLNYANLLGQQQMGQYGINQAPLQNLMQLLGLQTQENIVSQYPSLIGTLGQLGTGAGMTMMGVGAMG